MTTSIDDLIVVVERAARRQNPNVVESPFYYLLLELGRLKWEAMTEGDRYTITEAGRAMLRDAQQSSPDRQQGVE